ncbi:MAG TPA: hypothetical protein VNW97_15245 [Candidatus Saccharimonadales bacterium]|nr:hypothetical protein [Candidatus Saccharimonadales bacterium]
MATIGKNLRRLTIPGGGFLSAGEFASKFLGSISSSFFPASSHILLRHITSSWTKILHKILNFIIDGAAFGGAGEFVFLRWLSLGADR